MKIYLGVERSLKSVLATATLLLTGQFVSGQIQIEKKEFQAPELANNLLSLSKTVMDHADFDGDGDQDLIMCGYYFDSDTCLIYENQGNGILSVMTNSNVHKFGGQFAIGDLDGDMDMDLAFIYDHTTGGNNLIMYLNNGSGVFTPQSFPAFETTSTANDIEIADIDGDNDQDIMFEQLDGMGGYQMITLSNDGSANFSASTNPSIITTGISYFDLADIDGDNDLDLVSSTGYFHPSASNLYENDGNGNFTPIQTGTFNIQTRYEARFQDFNGDQIVDILLGDEVYLNDGLGTFNLVGANNLSEIWHVDFADIDGDSDVDMVASLGIAFGRRKVYLNDGSGMFTANQNIPFNNSRSLAILLFDFNGDGQEDLIQSGYNGYSWGFFTDLFINNSGVFTEIYEDPIKEIIPINLFLEDLDGDNDLDLFVNGYQSDYLAVQQVYKNDGFGNYALHYTGNFNGLISFSPANTCHVSMGDVDGDNDMDIVYKDYTSFPYMTKVMVNDGSGNFSDLPSATFQGLNGEDILADLDGDNDLDIISTGAYSPTDIKVFENDGNANFTEIMNTGLAPAIGEEIRVADFDGDNDNDVLMFGSDNSKIYLNDGNANFTENTGQPFKRLRSYGGLIEVGDIDGDNDLDLFATGEDVDNGYQMESEFYLNDGNGNFTLGANTGPYILHGDIEFVDLDNDSDLDMIISGDTLPMNAVETVSQIYENDGNGNFTLDEMASSILFQADSSRIITGDIDNDGDSDVVLGGLMYNRVMGLKIYENLSYLMVAENENSTSDLRIFPNPSNGQFTVSSKELIGQDIQLFDAVGRMVFRQRHQAGTSQLNLTQLKAGNYIVRLGNESYKLIIQ